MKKETRKRNRKECERGFVCFCLRRMNEENQIVESKRGIKLWLNENKYEEGIS